MKINELGIESWEINLRECIVKEKSDEVKRDLIFRQFRKITSLSINEKINLLSTPNEEYYSSTFAMTFVQHQPSASAIEFLDMLIQFAHFQPERICDLLAQQNQNGNSISHYIAKRGDKPVLKKYLELLTILRNFNKDTNFLLEQTNSYKQNLLTLVFPFLDDQDVYHSIYKLCDLINCDSKSSSWQDFFAQAELARREKHKLPFENKMEEEISLDENDEQQENFRESSLRKKIQKFLSFTANIGTRGISAQAEEKEPLLLFEQRKSQTF